MDAARVVIRYTSIHPSIAARTSPFNPGIVEG